MPKLTGTFSADGDESLELAVPAGATYYLALAPSPSLTGSIALLSRTDSLAAFETVATFTAANTGTEYVNSSTETVYLRLRCIDLDAGTETVGYVLQSLMSGTRVLVNGVAKVGATAGWAVGFADNLGSMATLEAGQTASTLVARVDGLAVGDVIRGFYPVGQVESGGNTASLTVNLRKLTSAAAGVTDASVATSGSISYTADAVLGRRTQPVENLRETVAEGESYYFLVTGTTAASTDIDLQGIMVVVG